MRISALASDAFNNFQIPVYVIGIEGAGTATINSIATAGGTTAHFATVGTMVEQDLIKALTAIRGSTLSCDFPMPKAQTGGMAIDPTKVNVNLTPSGGTAEIVGQAADANACQNGGWYYDVPAAPTKIVLCPSTCMRAQGDTGTKLDILLGCKAVPAEPPK
jgi:hypothetical protein